MSNTINWVEIRSNDTGESQKFFSEVFGWQFQEMMPGYVTFTTPAGMEGTNGGFGTGENGPAQGQLLYVSVDSIEDTLAKIEANGGKTHFPKMQLPNDYGYIAQFTDPHGITWGLWAKG